MPRCLLQIQSIVTAKDSWGRTAVAHAVLSGRPQVFDAIFEALRAEIRDDEVRSSSGRVSRRSLEPLGRIVREFVQSLDLFCLALGTADEGGQH